MAETNRGIKNSTREDQRYEYSPFFRENFLTVTLLDLKDHTDGLESDSSYYYQFKPAGYDFFDFEDKCHIRYLPF
jgi:hypothetical protein